LLNFVTQIKELHVNLHSEIKTNATTFAQGHSSGTTTLPRLAEFALLAMIFAPIW